MFTLSLEVQFGLAPGWGTLVLSKVVECPLRDQDPFLWHHRLQHMLANKMTGNEMVPVLGEPCGPPGRSEDMMAGSGLDLDMCCVQLLRSRDRLREGQQQVRKMFHAGNLGIKLQNNKKGYEVFPS